MKEVKAEGEIIKNGTMRKKWSYLKQCVQLCQFDSQLVNAQRSDSSVFCVCVCVCFKTVV